MIMRTILKVLLISCIVSTAGCISFASDTPSKQNEPVAFYANNTASSPYTFEVFVTDHSTNVSVRESDGKSYSESVTLGGVTTSRPSEGHHFTEVRPDSGRHHGNFTVNSGESVESNITDLPIGVVILVVVYNDENQIVQYSSATCDDESLLAFGLIAYSNGIATESLCD
ncbi:hypothetical protein [Halogeometricum limi]|uniref:hypothetical protein n=1 Tax=Halogeometricum limi TaxID=555875 RepID=UPI00111368DF|nr:hypothetical protein [Halogeometricum limi]